MLAAYPADPLVLDSWELENIFDEEFGNASGAGKRRREAIRREHEALWSTGQWGPPNYIPPAPPISAHERQQFNSFHGPRTQSYSCVLPGELVRHCVDRMSAGVLDAVQLLHLEHLVVDEYQDLNPMDLQFVDLFVTQGAHVFVCGDDDQSIYSFRFASPAGIQTFVTKYPACGQHTLSACFRCAPAVLDAAVALIAANPQPQRIAKHHASLYGSASPPLSGAVHRWRFNSETTEARAIAESCRDLIAAGLAPRDLLILVSNKNVLLPGLVREFQRVAVDFESPREESFVDSKGGRLALAVLRIVGNADDYVAHRALLGLRHGVGIGSCDSVTASVIANNLNYRSVFYQPLPAGFLRGRPLAALTAARAICSQMQQWSATDLLGLRAPEIEVIVAQALGTSEAQAWSAYAAQLPPGISLEEVRDHLQADTDEQQEALLRAVLTRQNLPIPPNGVLPPRVRAMTMHGAKGLSGKIVFIPGLEEEILPGQWRRPYPGLVLEAARMLYVSVTRARAACIISYATNRTVNGQRGATTPSRFAVNLNGQFLPRTAGLAAPEVLRIRQEVAQL